MTEENASWQKLYKAAMLELDPVALPISIEAARLAIRQALEGLASDGTAEASEKRQALSDALGNLQTLHRLELRPSTPASQQRGPSAER